MTPVPYRHLHEASLVAGRWRRGIKIRLWQNEPLQQRIGVSRHLLGGTRSPASGRQMQLLLSQKPLPVLHGSRHPPSPCHTHLTSPHPQPRLLLPPLPLLLLSGEDLSESIYSFKESRESHYNRSAVAHAPSSSTSQLSGERSHTPPFPQKRLAFYPYQMSYDFSRNPFLDSHRPPCK